jgi:hypothetical protein
VSFLELFRAVSSGEDPQQPPEDRRPPSWWGPSDDELGEPVACSQVIACSERAVVALREVIAYSNGLVLDLLAAARGLREAEASRLFHEQHLATALERVTRPLRPEMPNPATPKSHRV